MIFKTLFTRKQTKRQNAVRSALIEMYSAAIRADHTINVADWNDNMKRLIEPAYYRFQEKFAIQGINDFVTFLVDGGHWRHAFNFIKWKYPLAVEPVSTGDRAADFEQLLQMFGQFDYFENITQGDIDAFVEMMIQQYNYSQTKRVRDLFNVAAFSFNLKNPLVLAALNERVKFWQDHNNTLYTNAVRTVATELYNGAHPYYIAGSRRKYDDNGNPLDVQVDTVLTDILSEKTPYQVRRFARTEAAYLLEKTQEDHVVMNRDVYELMEWNAKLDPGTRWNHKAMDGETRPLDGEYIFTTHASRQINVKHPVDPRMDAPDSGNCRCTNIAIVGEVDPTQQTWWTGN